MLITGAGHGIGRAAALRFCAEGAQVSLVDLDGAAVEAAARAADARAHPLAAGRA